MQLPYALRGKSFCVSVLAASLILLSSCGGADSKTLKRLIGDLQSKETSSRNQAALKLASYGESAAPAVPALAQRLKDPNGGVRSSAAFALRAIGNKEANAALESYQK